MNTVLRYKDMYASYELSIENRIICAEVSGAIGNGFSTQYNHDFGLLMDRLGPGPWGHFADFRHCEALTTEAQDASKILHYEAQKRGCVISAFQMKSALLISQVNTIRQDNNLPTLASQRFFESKPQAIEFIENFLVNAQQVEKTS
jgi:hypothetical protein